MSTLPRLVCFRGPWCPAPDGGRAQEVREFKTTVGGLLVLHDWLKAHGVTQVAMEATGVYWKPVWADHEVREAHPSS